jgi:hypothetical protein
MRNQLIRTHFMLSFKWKHILIIYDEILWWRGIIIIAHVRQYLDTDTI